MKIKGMKELLTAPMFALFCAALTGPIAVGIYLLGKILKARP